MKKTILFLALSSLSISVKSQNANVERSVFGIQTGLIGIWVHNETKLANQIALRSEIGLDVGIWDWSFYTIPVITAEPRWYYNLNKRVSNSKRIDGNSGDFISLKTSFHPDWFIIPNSDYFKSYIISDISIVPTWGIRRNIGKHFNYEIGIGYGYRYIFAKQAGNLENESEPAFNLRTRIGYRF